MLGETNFVRIVRVGVVAEYRLGPVGVFRRRDDFASFAGALGLVVGDVIRREALGDLRLASGVFEPVELGRVHLWRLQSGGRGFGAHVVGPVGIRGGETVVVHRLAAHVVRGESGFFAESERVDVGAGNGGGGGAKVEYPDDLTDVSSLVR